MDVLLADSQRHAAEIRRAEEAVLGSFQRKTQTFGEVVAQAVESREVTEDSAVAAIWGLIHSGVLLLAPGFKLRQAKG